MAEIKVQHDDFYMHSNWRVVTNSNGAKEITEGPSVASNVVTFEYDLPEGTTIKSAKVHSSWTYPTSGFYFRHVNGVAPDSAGLVDVEIDPAATSVNVAFSFRAVGSTSVTGIRTDTTLVHDVYLLIETGGGQIYRAEGGKLVPYQLCRAEGGQLVPYQLCRAEGGQLVPYS